MVVSSTKPEYFRDASFVTGTDVLVDGGYCAMGPEQHGQASKFAGCDY